MDKRFKPLTMAEELAVRRALLDDIEANPGRSVPEVIRLVRTTLRLTMAEYAKLCGVSARGLQDIERGIKSPTLETVAKLLRPMGLRAGVVTRDAVARAESALKSRKE
ncbi:MAG TPA: helix-turn-helix transcriptional regulator [Luteibacter sp.]|uniref:helix-turn-helix domain-containing protein n=1 Tax=Luteibacter sp. TaxID=1886636 RepID=UPI002C57C7BD|nr:helix-turn-helix transcriptional regulator [Luteibacter sp.]HVI56632.1 helix-turn-helix transcriptional regulator [Luteibacter sp.]